MKLKDLSAIANRLEEQDDQIHRLQIENDRLKNYIKSAASNTLRDFFAHDGGAQMDIELARISIKNARVV